MVSTIPLSDLSLINSVKADIGFDQTWPVSDLVNLVLDFHSVDINSVPQLTLPVQVVNDPNGSGGALIYEGGTYGDVEFPSEAQDLSAIDQVLGIGPERRFVDGQPTAGAFVGVRFGTQRHRERQSGGGHRISADRSRVPCRRRRGHSAGR